MRPGLEWDDLEQAARLGLLEAARRFRPQLGTAFSTFAVPYIVGEIRRFLQRSHPVAGLGGVRELLRRAEQRRARLEAAGAGPVTLAQLAVALDVEPAELALAVAAAAPPLSLDLPAAHGVTPEGLAARHGSSGQRGRRGGAGGPAGPGDPGGSPGPDGPDEDRLAVRLALGRLPAELARIVYLRFFRGWTQQEVARRLGLSQPVVSRRERLALSLLRQELDASEPPAQARTQLPEGPAVRPAKAP